MRRGRVLDLLPMVGRWFLAVMLLTLVSSTRAGAQGCEDCAEIKAGRAGRSTPEVTSLEVETTNNRVSVPVASSLVTETRVTSLPTLDANALWVPTRPSGLVVKAVIFWMSTCPHCHEVIDQVLPPLQSQYGDRLQIQMIELGESGTDERDRLFYRAAEAFGIAHDRAGVPFLVIGDKGLMGPDQIRTELPGLIQQHLAAGGVDYPQIAGLAPLLSAEKDAAELCAPAAPCADATPAPAELTQAAAAPVGAAPGATPQSNGFALALVIMAAMVAALVYTGVVIVRGSQGGPVHPPASWQWWLVLALALAGLGVAGYLAYVETLQVAAVCGPVGNCNTVQSSPYARLFGFLPVGVLGALGYLAILAAWLYGRWQSDRPPETAGGRLARYAPVAVFGMALFGVCFSLFLTYLEPFVIGAVCAWCLTSAVIMTLLLVLSSRPALAALAEDGGE
jgi:uncharacterized membrane protein